MENDAHPHSGRDRCRLASRRQAALLVCAGMCLMLVAACVSQQERRYGLRTAEVTDIRGYAEVQLRQREREQASKVNTGRTRTKETILEEQLGFELDGYVLHPDVLELALGGVLGLVQSRYEETISGRSQSDTQSGELIEFDLNANLVKNRAYPANVFATRTRRYVPRPFLPSLETTSTSYGFTWQYVSAKTPMRLHASHVDTKQVGLYVRPQEEDGRQRITELAFDTSYVFSDQNKLSFAYEHRTAEEEPYTFDYDSDEVTLSHHLEWGGRRQYRLKSQLDALDQRGTVDLQRVRWREDLRLKHTESFETFYHVEALDRTRGNRSPDVSDVEERSYFASAGLRHQLYQSQTIQLRAYAQRQDFKPNLEITRWGWQGTLNYRKKNPLGVLHMNYGIRSEWNENRGSARTNEVIEELHTFRDPDPIRLTNRNIRTSSITLRAEDNITLYQRGRDFVVTTLGNEVEIERVVTGRIADGASVLIDYTFASGGNFELTTVNHTAGARQAFSFGLEPYYRFEWQDQTLAPVRASGAVAEDITAHIAGIEFRKATLHLFAEYEDRDSTINAFKATRLGASFTHRFKSGLEAGLHGRWTDTSFEGSNARDIRLLTCEARNRYPVTRNLTFEGSVFYRDGHDSRTGESDGLDVSLALEWIFRDTEFRVSYEYDEFEDRFARNDATMLYVQIRRDL